MSLHLVFSIAGLETCLKRRQVGDPVVLLGDGVYAQQRAPTAESMLLVEDAVVRGITVQQSIEAIDYAQLVQLTVEHKPIVSWND